MDAGFFLFLLWFLGLFILYWVIRLAVRHALQDVAGRRGGTEYLLSQPPGPATPRAD